MPVDDLYAVGLLCEAVQSLGLDDCVVVSPDVGFAAKARQFASRLGAPLAIANKQRAGHNGDMTIDAIVGDVAGKSALIVDDFIVNGGTLINVAKKLAERGARDVMAAVTHGVMTPAAMGALDASPISKLLVTDTAPLRSDRASAKVKVVPAAPLLAEAIRRINARQSISALFDKPQEARP